jgi:hypothetical protein
MEYYEALDRRVKQHDFPVVLVLLDGQPAPGLPFLRQLHWVITTDPASEKSLVQLMDATSGGGAPLPEELWRHSAPYRGLQAMTESDADFFFGRVRETAEVIGALAEAPDKLAILGNAQFPVTPKSAARRCPDFATTVIPKGPSVWRSRLFPAAPHGFSTAGTLTSPFATRRAAAAVPHDGNPARALHAKVCRHVCRSAIRNSP